MYWLLIPTVLALAALLLLHRAKRIRRRRTPHTYIPPCIEK